MAPRMTPAVTAICDGIDADRAYDRLPVLADALEDAGCDEATLTAWLRTVTAPANRYYRRVVEGYATCDDVCDAVKRLTEIGQELLLPERSYAPEYYERLQADPVGWAVQTCRDGGFTFDGYHTPDEAGEYLPDMWKHYRILTGEGEAVKPEDQDEDGDVYTPNPPVYFSCSC